MANHFALPALSSRFFPVWRRNFLVWRKLAIPSVLGNLADPMIYMLGLGYGLGALLPEIGGGSYIAFLAAGTVCYSTMNSATFEALYSGFSRMHVQRTWDAILNAPLALDDVILAASAVDHVKRQTNRMLRKKRTAQANNTIAPLRRRERQSLISIGPYQRTSSAIPPLSSTYIDRVSEL